MRFLRKANSWVRGKGRRGFIARDIDAEFDAHLEERVRENQARGMDPDAARRSALTRFGNRENNWAQAMDIRTGADSLCVRIPETLATDIRYSMRRLFRSPLFFATAILIIGLGIGANTAIFSVVYTLLGKPLPYTASDDVLKVYATRDGSRMEDLMSYPDFRVYAALDEVFSETGATNDLTLLNRITPDGAEAVLVGYLSASYFNFYGVTPYMGRFFSVEEDDPDASLEPVAVVGYSAWKTKHGGDPSVLGQRIVLNGHSVTVVGVGPADFKGQFPGLATDYWLSWSTANQVDPTMHLRDPDYREWTMYARLRPGVTLAQARDRVQSAQDRLAEEFPEIQKERGVMVVKANDFRLGAGLDMALYPVSIFLMAIVGLVLLVACSNLAGLLLVRASSRRQESAVRLALGAGRARLVFQLLTESILLGVSGGLAGLILATWLTSGIISVQPNLPVSLSFDFSPDLTVLLFTLALSIVTGGMVGLAPALRLTNRRDFSALKNDSLALGANRRMRLGNVLVIAQLSLSLVLLIAAGLCLHGLVKGSNIDPGFRTEGTGYILFELALGGLTEPDEIDNALGRLRERALADPDIEEIALTHRVPLGFWGSDRIPVQRSKVDADADELAVDYSIVDPHFFSLMDIQIVAGRGFLDSDSPSSEKAVVVNQALAEVLWPGQPVVGQLIETGSRGAPVPVRVVGIAGNTLVRSIYEEDPQLYFPLAQKRSSRLAMLARGRVDPALLVEKLRAELTLLNRDVPVFEAQTLEQHMESPLFFQRTTATFLATFGGLALLLAGIGLHGLVAFSAMRRTRELGIRMALGATRKDVMRLVLGEGLRLSLIGGVVGLVFAQLLAIPLSKGFMGVSSWDPWTMGGVALLLGLVTVAACYLPARRVARVDPMRILKYE